MPAISLKRAAARIASSRGALKWSLAAAAVVTGVLVAGIAATEIQEARMERDVARILELIENSDSLSFHERVDRVRRFVNRNSRHLIDEEFWSYNHDEPRVVRMLLDRGLGVGKKPHLECSSRSRVMAKILEGLGIPTRLVHLYQPIRNFPSHTYLEVFNTTTQSWEIQDPDYDLFYVDATGQQRLSTEMMLSRPLDTVRSCHEPQKCGWTLVTREEKRARTLRDYFKAAVIRDRRGLTLLVNQDRFDLERPQSVEGRMVTFCEHDPELCSGSLVEVGGI